MFRRAGNRIFSQVARMSSKGSPYDAKVVAVTELQQGKWIQTRSIKYHDPNGNERLWEMAVRTTTSKTLNIDAVSIVPILKHPSKPDEIVMIKQFRPPTEKVVIELPAGLVDPNETVELTAIRELIEETGYYGKFVKQSIPMVSDPGLTNASMVLAYVDVDLTDSRNVNPEPKLEEGEFIETFRLPVQGLLQNLLELVDKEGCTVDARLYHLAVGLLLVE